ncbi:Na+/H+ antiporter NhaA [Pectinatus haikarae]|uniref:Na+/H+ antiporter NhaA n=1 Tax=Pectinatus haikarae TaxID=349096 RepID=UPI001E60D58A|nr:Na+/H+ antiporter NhaA [Pectinatus haikarae]
MKYWKYNITQKATVLLKPFNHFFRHKSSSSVILLLFAILAMLLANSGISAEYQAVLNSYFSMGIIKLSVLHWVNDGLMTIFFFVIGLEIKREFLFGELKSLSATVLPIAAAIGGMLVPACIYYIINQGEPTSIGWGIPMATDIAFSLGILSLAAGSAPRSIAIFLTALAIVDDLGAIIIIALFYSTDIQISALSCGLASLLTAALFSRYNCKYITIYLLTGLAAWFSFYNAGIHPTIAGVALGLIIPANAAQDMKKSLLHRLEHILAPWSAWFIMPAFALANAGIKLNFSEINDLFTHEGIGILAGLALGKPLGIFGTVFLLFKTGFIKMPESTTYSHFLGAGVLSGIGFTMSFFIASLAFADIPEYLTTAKLGIILGSILSGLAGAFIFKFIDYRTT